MWAMMPVYSSLLRYSPFELPESLASIESELAERWTLDEEGLSLTFQLRDDVRWHDGEPFTSQDVRFTVEMLVSGEGLESNPRQHWYSNIQSVETPSESEVVLHLERPQPSLLTLLASGVSPIYPAHFAVDNPGIMRQVAMGTGPFVFSSYLPEAGVITLKKNELYFDRLRPYLDEISYIVAGPSLRRAIVESGLAEISPPLDLSAGDVEAIRKKNPSLVVQEAVSTASRRLLFNHGREPWSDPDVRRAVSLALNRTAYSESVPEGSVSVGGVMPPSGTWALPVEDVEKSPGYGEDAQGDLTQAETLLAGAGYSGGLSATIAVQGDRLSDDVQFVVSRLALLGVDASVSRIEPADWRAFLRQGEYDLALVRSILPVHDVDAALLGMYSCDAPGNYGGYCDRDLERLIEGQSKQRNVGLRLKGAHYVLRRLLEDVADVVLGWEVNYMMVSPRLRGWQVHPSPFNNARMQDVWLNKRSDS